MRVHIVRRSLLELSRSKVEIVETVSYSSINLIKKRALFTELAKI